MRAASPTEALAARHIELVQEELKKVYVFHCDINSSQLPPHFKEELSTQFTHIIHCAWPVNFNLPLSAFKEHFRNLQSLLQFSLATNSPKPIHLIFCSSVSAALNHPSLVPERPLVSPDDPAPTGYGQSKSVAEKINPKGRGERRSQRHDPTYRTSSWRYITWNMERQRRDTNHGAIFTDDAYAAGNG